MDEAQREEFLSNLIAGKIRVVNAETHPFAFADDIDLCTRCGTAMKDGENRTFQVAAYVNEQKQRVHPAIIVECDPCLEIPEENRSADASFIAA